MWVDIGNATDEWSLSWYFAQHGHGCFQTNFRKQHPNERQIGVVDIHHAGGDDIVDGCDGDLQWSKINCAFGRLLGIELWVERDSSSSGGTSRRIPYGQLIGNDEPALNESSGDEHNEWQDNCQFNSCLTAFSASKELPAQSHPFGREHW